jgi:hypothetical protein
MSDKPAQQAAIAMAGRSGWSSMQPDDVQLAGRSGRPSTSSLVVPG